MKKLSLVFIILAGFTSKSFCQGPGGDGITGLWLSEEKDGKIEIYKQDNRFFGKLIWASDMYEKDGHTLAKDTNNPDRKLRERPLIGIVILTGFVYKNGEWTNGEIYDPDNGKTYKCTMSLKDGNLHIRGYIGIPLIGRTTIWTKDH